MSKQADELLQILLATRIDAVGVHCSPEPDPEPDDGDEPTPGDDDPAKPSPYKSSNGFYL